MTCECCTAAKESPDHRMYDPACLWCGARLLRNLRRHPITTDQLKARRQTVLSDWMRYGHAEADLRAWAKRDDCFDPGPECGPESEPRKPTKRR